MHKTINLLITISILTLSGCASIEPLVDRYAELDGVSGYIAGNFTRINSGGFAFAIKNINTNQEYGLSLGEDTFFPKNVENQVIAIQVPPGRYKIDHWYTYGTLNKSKNGKFSVNNPYLADEFDIKNNTVLFLGKFEILTKTSSIERTWTVKPKPLTHVKAKNDFVNSFPFLQEAQFNCLLCLY
ncbi:hypothetical protein [Zooshikella ganghwensis]|uniref:Uncharacterized protein n=1 Tax=Zooshikella ganghwensis TaxID=202772 RepID=A0A4P9VM35_9GAMM|nr:hypothetical protein [Zooshikella ganghwensis]RDH44445.1 hypothetical protein B9G39_13920 [Zooshikella ganghwensis]